MRRKERQEKVGRKNNEHEEDRKIGGENGEHRGKELIAQDKKENTTMQSKQKRMGILSERT